jgi:hypothetical protein
VVTAAPAVHWDIGRALMISGGMRQEQRVFVRANSMYASTSLTVSDWVIARLCRFRQYACNKLRMTSAKRKFKIGSEFSGR